MTGVPSEHSSNESRRDSREAGSSRIDLLLDGVTVEQVEALAERIADLCLEFGLGCDDEGDPVLSLIAVRGYEWPEEFEELFHPDGALSGAAQLLIPSRAADGHIGAKGDGRDA